MVTENRRKDVQVVGSSCVETPCQDKHKTNVQEERYVEDAPFEPRWMNVDMGYVNEGAIESVEEVLEFCGCRCEGRWEGFLRDTAGRFTRALLRFGRHRDVL